MSTSSQPQWEYLMVEIDATPGGGYFDFVQRRWRDLNCLGDEGWELVTMLPTYMKTSPIQFPANTTPALGVFKRIK